MEFEDIMERTCMILEPFWDRLDFQLMDDKAIVIQTIVNSYGEVNQIRYHTECCIANELFNISLDYNSEIHKEQYDITVFEVRPLKEGATIGLIMDGEKVMNFMYENKKWWKMES